MIRKTLPSKDQWAAVETSRMLLGPRTYFLAFFFVLAMAVLLIPHAPVSLVIVWMILIFGTYIWIMKLVQIYLRLGESQSSGMTPQMTQVLQRYKTAWYFLCTLWGVSAFLSQIWLPDLPRVLCIVIFNGLMFLIISRTYMDRRVMHTGSAILILLLFMFALLRLTLNRQNEQVFLQFSGLTFYLVLTWYLLVIVGDRFHQMHQQRMDSEYSKLELIDSLGDSQEKLRLEQQALIGANSVIQQFYSAAAHDLRQPVYAMQIYTEMLLDDPTRAKTLLPKISQSCSAVNIMFNTLFDFQKMHAADLHLESTKVNISEVFENLALHFEPIATIKSLHIRFKPLTGCVTMEPLYLIRILSNLITNAIRYTASGGVIVGVRKTKTHLRFEVWDTGIGIDHTFKDQIFTEFFKVNHSDIKNENLGLGLAIVKKLVARIEGADIVVKSTLGRGSVFRLQVPIVLYSAS
ncbi:MAG: HAMP domain-containing sensor histidine kinase [Burkholderiaceae bacterium]